jgi:hypothetical protein
LSGLEETSSQLLSRRNEEVGDVNLQSGAVEFQQTYYIPYFLKLLIPAARALRHTPHDD